MCQPLNLSVYEVTQKLVVWATIRNSTSDCVLTGAVITFSRNLAPKTVSNVA